MPNRTTFTSNGPPNKKVIEPDRIGPDDQAAPIADSAAEVKIAADSATPRLADEFGAPVHLNA